MGEFLKNEPVIVRTVLAIIVAAAFGFLFEGNTDIEILLQIFSVLGIAGSARNEVTPVHKITPQGDPDDVDV